MRFIKKLIIALVLLLVGYAIATFVIHNYSHKNTFKNQRQNNKLSTIIDLINKNYVDKVNKNELVEKGIKEVIENLDPHTTYISARDYARANEELEGKFGGIGIQFLSFNDTITVVRCIEKGPSEKEGIISGDRIVTVNDSIVASINISTQGIMDLLKGKVGSIVNVGVKKRGANKLQKITIQRDLIPIKSVEVAYMLNSVTGYILISRFSRNTYFEFRDAIYKLKNEGMNKLIIDLRSNSGGFMEAATAIVNEFLPAKTLIVYTQGKYRKKLERRANGKGKFQKLPIIVLINESSASASEIFAGAIQDNDRGLIIGRRSFGKGLVQEAHNFSDGSSLRLTVSRYYTPTGRCIQKPYNPENKTEYYAEILTRYEKGEFQYESNTNFPDSLKKVTPNGKIVYGGGGIMPDVFVPLDTTEFTNYYSILNQKGIIRNFSFHYIDTHRTKLKNIKTYQQLENYLDNRNFMKEFLIYAKKNGVKKDNKAYAVSKNLIKLRLKALMGSDLLGSMAYYPIIHQRDHVLKKALSKI